MSNSVDLPVTTTVCRPDWPKSAVRIGFGIIWAIDAGLKWRTSFRTGYLS
jgi:hypothetical protein